MKPALCLLIPGILAGFVSCSKKSDAPALVIPKTVITRGEIVVAKIENAPVGTRFYWELPGSLNEPVEDRNSARLQFREAGTYTVRAYLFTSSDSVRYTLLTREVTVMDRDIQMAEANTPMPGDQLWLEPFLAADSTVGFILRTYHTYQCLNTYVTTKNAGISDTAIKFSATGLWIPGYCDLADVPAQSILFTRKGYVNNSFPIEVTFNNKTYSGMLTVKNYNRRYEFDWNYTEGVVISPKLIVK